MKKFLFLLCLIPSAALADRLGSLNSNVSVALSTQVVTGANTNYIQNSITPTTTTQIFSVSSGSVNGFFYLQGTGGSATNSRLSQTFYPLPRSGGFGPQTQDIILYGQVNQNSSQSGTFTLTASTVMPSSTFPLVSASGNYAQWALNPMGGDDRKGLTAIGFNDGSSSLTVNPSSVTVGGNLVVSGSMTAIGSVTSGTTVQAVVLRTAGATSGISETTTDPGVYMGYIGGNQRLLFANGTAAGNFQFDSEPGGATGPDFRLLYPSVIFMKGYLNSLGSGGTNSRWISINRLEVGSDDGVSPSARIYARHNSTSIPILLLGSDTSSTGHAMIKTQKFTSTSARRDTFDLIPEWADSTDATRKGMVRFMVYDFNGSREFMQATTDGTSAFTTFSGSVSFISTSAIQNTLTPTTTTQRFSVAYASASFAIVTSSMNVERKVTAYNQDAFRVDVKDGGGGFPTGFVHLFSADPRPILEFDNVNFEARTLGTSRWRVQPAAARMFMIPNGSAQPNSSWLGFMSSDETTIYARMQTANNTTGGFLFDASGSASANVLNLLGQASQTGVLLKLQGTSSTAAIRDQVDLDATFSDSTDATRKGRFIARVWDFNGAKEFMRADTDGTNPYSTITGSVTYQGSGTASRSAIILSTPTVGVVVSTGTNGIAGYATLTAGTVTVNNTRITANTMIMLTDQNGGVNIGAVYVSGRTPGTSFTITSTNVLDASSVAWLLIEPIP